MDLRISTVTNVIKKWAADCDSKHTCVTCNERQPNDDKDNRPTWVVDTRDMCIVSGATAGRYVALSYIWPENVGDRKEHLQRNREAWQPIQLDRARLSRFQIRGSLDESFNDLAKVIRDAIQLVKMIGERYLWVDRLCIVQDADDATASEVMKMDQIYVRAYLTVIAGGSDGLFTELTLSKKDLSQLTGLQMSEIISLENLKISDELSWQDFVNYLIMTHYSNLAESKWATRGWTYQEQILSKRSVVFLDEDIFWECDRSIWDEHALSADSDGPATGEASEMGRRLFGLKGPDFSLYIDLVCLYNYRKFSYEQDGLAAMSGIFNLLGSKFPGGFIAGLSTAFLDHALLWQPLHKGSRRVERPKNLDSAGSSPSRELPSWSWCGWQCLLDPWSFRTGLSSMNTPKHREVTGTWRTHNLVTWDIVSAPSGDVQRTIHEPATLDSLIAKTSGGSNTVIASRNRDHEPSLEKPMAASESPATYDQINNMTSRWLRCTTTRAFFQPAAVMQARGIGICLGAPKVSAFEHPMFTSCPEKEQAPPLLVLQDSSGRRSGLLRLMNDEPDYDDLGEVELIAISRGSCTARDFADCFEQQVFHRSVEWPGSTTILFYNVSWLHESLRSESQGPAHPLYSRMKMPQSLLQGSVAYQIDDTCEFYNVLWIERKDGVAYRRACGRILKPIWERSVAGETEVTLG